MTHTKTTLIYKNLKTNITHAEIGSILGITRQMVDKALRAGKEDLMNLYINRFEELIKERLG